MDKLDSYHLPVTGRNILRFAFPTIVMTVFNTFYTMVDGLFVSNLIGMEALSAINLTAPAIALITAISGMLATGGSAVVMKKMGEHREQEARQDFTLLILTNAVVGAVMMLLGYTLMDTLLGTMGLSPAVFGYCHTYLSNYLLFTIPILLMYNFSLYLIAADKSTLSLICTVAGGVTNIILDYALISLFDLGIQGAAIATGLGYSITAVVGFLVFRNRTACSTLKSRCPGRRAVPRLHQRYVGAGDLPGVRHHHPAVQPGDAEICGRGRRGGHHHHHVCTYVRQRPVHRLLLRRGPHDLLLPRGAEPREAEKAGGIQRQIHRRGIRPLYGYFHSGDHSTGGHLHRPDSPVYKLAVTGNRLCSIALLFVGLNVFASGMFTALSNGVVSAVLAFSRSFLFTVASIQIMPVLLGGVTGVWLATPVAELLGTVMAAALLLKYRKRYGY